MSVYVDELRDWGKKWLRTSRGMQSSRSCHLIADTLPELHAMADAIGMKRSWFQPRSTPHYDLTPSRRADAVKRGAVEVDRVGFVTVVRRLRAALVPPPEPSE